MAVLSSDAVSFALARASVFHRNDKASGSQGALIVRGHTVFTPNNFIADSASVLRF